MICRTRHAGGRGQGRVSGGELRCCNRSGLIYVREGYGGDDHRGQAVEGDRNGIGPGGRGDQAPDLYAGRCSRINTCPDEGQRLASISHRSHAVGLPLDRDGDDQEPIGAAANRMVHVYRTGGSLNRAGRIDGDGLGLRATASQRGDEKRAARND